MSDIESDYGIIMIGRRIRIRITSQMNSSHTFMYLTKDPKTTWDVLSIVKTIASKYVQHYSLTSYDDLEALETFLKDLSRQLVGSNITWNQMLYTLGNPILGLRDIYRCDDDVFGMYQLLVLCVFAFIHSSIDGIQQNSEQNREQACKSFFYHFKRVFSEIIWILDKRSTKQFGHPHSVKFREDIIQNGKRSSVYSLISSYMINQAKDRQLCMKDGITGIKDLDHLTMSFIGWTECVIFDSLMIKEINITDFKDEDLIDLVLNYSLNGSVDTLHRIIEALDRSTHPRIRFRSSSRPLLVKNIWGETNPILIEIDKIGRYLSNYRLIVLTIFVYMIIMSVNEKAILRYVSSEKGSFLNIESDINTRYQEDCNIYRHMKTSFVENSVILRYLSKYLRMVEGKLCTSIVY